MGKKLMKPATKPADKLSSSNRPVESKNPILNKNKKRAPPGILGKMGVKKVTETSLSGDNSEVARNLKSSSSNSSSKGEMVESQIIKHNRKV